MKADILAIGAHPDDVELSAAGTLMREISKGKIVVLLDLTEGELGTRGTVADRYAEAAAASAIMGIHDRVNLKLKDGFFQHNEETLRSIISVIRHYRPEVVLANAVSDRHPDHGRAAELVRQACFYSGLPKIQTSYIGVNQTTWRPRTVYHYIQENYLKPDILIDISDFAERKIEAIKAYGSQFYKPGSTEPPTLISSEFYFDFLKGRWGDYGKYIGVKYAEGFMLTRPTGVDSITDLF
ncbi:MAG: bacillithiol biosynthesis deacetylase BshB1 [Crocinitomicaceae bacterium]|nr:bacillithiol biosynthesis deacetylase BshB1 [Crocinitomicaceae bacterium]MBK8924569.1 bacillithiol biosynthesis deacetylase BshB1 [Crocinitomicaceae bacterium]